MTKKQTTLTAIGMFLIGLILLNANTDREFINLAPTEGIPNGVVLDADTTYTQSFAATRTSISRVSLFLRPTTTNLPPSSATISLAVNGEERANQSIAAEFIDSSGASQVRFNPPIKVKEGDTINLSVSVPKELSGRLRAQLRLPDETFDNTYATFTIDQEDQEAPLAYQVYYKYRPPLSAQLAGLLITLAIILVLRNRIASHYIAAIYIAGLTLVATAPAILLGHIPYITMVATALAATSMWIFTKHFNLSLVARVTTIHVFGLTTWFALHTLAGREKLIALSVLPLLILLISNKGDKKNTQLRIATVAIFLLLAILLPWQQPTISPSITASPRDVFLDPNQVPSSIKFDSDYTALHIPQRDPESIEEGGGWDNFGSYTGIIATALAGLGILTNTKRHWKMLTVGIIGLLIAATPAITPLINQASPLPAQYFIILTTFSIALFAGLGLQSLYNFIGSSKVSTIIVYTIATFILLDMLHVVGRTLEFGLL